ncbi:MAG TPA: hypothetical protein VKB81_01195 [Nitrospira sp.]|nr:hypothetical protein [Nitrospira sp.]
MKMTFEHVWHRWVYRLKRDRSVVCEQLKEKMKVARKFGQHLQAYFRMSERPTYEEGVTVRTEPPSHPSIFWVLIEGVQKPRTHVIGSHKALLWPEKVVCVHRGEPIHGG